MNTPRMTIGFVGAGGSATHHLAGCVHSGRVGAAVLVEADDDARARLCQRYGLIKSAHADLAPLLARSEIQWVCVCGSIAQRADTARQLLQAGKDVILDGPPAQTVAELDELARLAQEMQRHVLCALNPLYTPAQRKVRELLSRQELPAPVHATALSILSVEGAADDVLAAAFDAIVALQEFLPPVTDVLGASVTGTSAAALLRLPDGVTAQLSILRSATGERPWGERRVFTSEGMIWLRDNPEDETPLLVAHGADLSSVRVKAPPDVYEYAAVQCMEHLLACAVAGEGEPALFAQARAALATWEAVCASAAAASPSA